MANMSYCRFRNTLFDLRDCSNNIYDDDLDKEEQQARKSLIELCKQIADDFTDENGDINLGELT
jgi:hypothetical protein